MNTGRKVTCFLSVFVCVHPWLIPSAAAIDPAGTAVLHLADGSFLPGEPRGSDDPKVLRWRSPYFARPFDFPLGGVNAVHYAVPPQPPKPSGEYCLELANDDVLYG